MKLLKSFVSVWIKEEITSIAQSNNPRNPPEIVETDITLTSLFIVPMGEDDGLRVAFLHVTLHHHICISQPGKRGSHHSVTLRKEVITTITTNNNHCIGQLPASACLPSARHHSIVRERPSSKPI